MTERKTARRPASAERRKDYTNKTEKKQNSGSNCTFSIVRFSFITYSMYRSFLFYILTCSDFIHSVLHDLDMHTNQPEA